MRSSMDMLFFAILLLLLIYYFLFLFFMIFIVVGFYFNVRQSLVKIYPVLLLLCR